MKTLRLGIGCALIAFALLAGPAAYADYGKEAPAKGTDCVKVRTDAPYRAYGYDHLVEVHNRCEYAVSCVAKTDADPETPAKLVLLAGEKKSLMTRRGSPASEFKADVACQRQTTKGAR